MPDQFENIFEALDAPNQASTWEKTRVADRADVGELLFPHVKTPGLTLSFVSGEEGFPIALKPSEYDTKATVRDYIGVKELQYEMPFFREGASLKEKLRQAFIEYAAADNTARYDAMVQKIYDDRSQLVSGALVQAERMRVQLLQRGSISISDNRVAYEYDYRFPNENKLALAGAECWDQHGTSDPYETIQAVQELMESRTDITRAICTAATFRHMMKSESIRKALNLHHHEDVKITKQAVRSFIKEDLGVSFLIVGGKYRLSDGGTEYPYWDDGVVTFIPEGFLGKTHWGTTPEEHGLMTGTSRANVAVADKGISIMTYTEEHPVNHVMIVSSVMLPSFEQMNKVCIARVF